MYARIGTSGSRHGDVLTQEKGKGVLEGCLHALAVGLHLPPVVVGAVVGEFDEIAQGGMRNEE